MCVDAFPRVGVTAKAPDRTLYKMWMRVSKKKKKKKTEHSVDAGDGFDNQDVKVKDNLD